MEPREHIARVFGNEPQSVYTPPPPQSLVRFIQSESQKWREKNFPPGHRTVEYQALGIAEEAGELCHAVLKRAQGIRGTPEEHRRAIADALGDLFIYSCGVAANEGFDLHEIYRQTWDAVARRDWTQHKDTGIEEGEESGYAPTTGQEGPTEATEETIRHDRRGAPRAVPERPAERPIYDGEVCGDCGAGTIRSGTCRTCPQCGWTSGCG